MKITALALIFLAAISASEANLRGIHENDAAPSISDQRHLKKDKKAPKPPKDSGDGGGGNTITDDTNRAGVDDGTCCNGPAQPQPATGPGNRAPSNCPELGKQLPVYSIKKGSQEYIDGIPPENACTCNDQCAFQDGASMVCCLQSHYFVDTNRHPISVCVDTTGLNESVMNGCLVGGSGGNDDVVPVLRSSGGGIGNVDPLDYDLMGKRR